LLITPGHRLPRDRVLDLLWPDATPESADQALRKAVHLLRRVLEPGLKSGRGSAYLMVSGDLISLQPGIDLWVDVVAFESSLASTRATQPPHRRAHLRQALSLYTGDLLQDEPYAAWASTARERLRHLHRQAVLDLATLNLDAGEPAESVPLLERLLDADLTDEPLVRALMRALAVTGRNDEAIRLYHRSSVALREDLDVAPEAETQDLFDEITSRITTPSVLPPITGVRPPASVPAPPTPIVGRVREMEHLQHLLLNRNTRLVTVTGPGGVGKTRLAQEVALQIGDDFADGVCFVALATVRDHSLVLSAIAHALGLTESDRYTPEGIVQAALRERDVLLVLDNTEQVLDAATQIALLLEQCHRLTVLVTSREPLRIRAEQEMPLFPLAVPDVRHGGNPRILARYEAVELFLRRAQAVQTTFTLTDENAAAVVSLCNRLDGLPLAIELAAAQVRNLSPELLLAGLTDRFALLSGGYRDLPARQQSLHDAIAWSYDLLPPSRRSVFRTLAVFAGGFTADDAEDLIHRMGDGRQAAVTDALASLVTASLLQRTGDGSRVRYSMLESIHEYGLMELTAGGDVARARSAHAAWCLALAERFAPRMTASPLPEELDRVEAELENIRAALVWSLDQPGAEPAMRLAGTLRHFWLMRGYLVEGRDWLERALSQPEPADPAVRVKAIFAAGELSFFLEDYSRARSYAEEGLAICQGIGDTQGAADALLGLGHIARETRDMDGATAFLEEGLSLARSIGNEVLGAMIMEALGYVSLEQGDLETAEIRFAEVLRHYRQTGDAWGEAALLSAHAKVLFRRGKSQQARALMQDALNISQRLKDPYASSEMLFNLGTLLIAEHDIDQAAGFFRKGLVQSWENRLDVLVASFLIALAANEDDCERAAQVFGATDAFCRAVGITMPELGDDVPWQANITTGLARSKAQYAPAWAIGQSLSPGQAVALALGKETPGLPSH
jgi:predicted ATPase/DNA-binding SARP family transcriptional activator